MIRWNVVTYKNGERKDHFYKTNDNVGSQQVADAFALKYCGEEGEVLEIIPLED